MEAKQELLNFTGKECPKEGEKPEEQNLFDGKEELLGWLSPLSKAQRNFLYGYFLELGRKKEAEYYLEEAF